LISELLSIAEPGLREIVTRTSETQNEDIENDGKKVMFLKLWDEATEAINLLWSKLEPEEFQKSITLFGQYEGTVWSSIFYFIDNEIHHRGQGYVYLRSLDIEPPFFYDRS